MTQTETAFPRSFSRIQRLGLVAGLISVVLALVGAFTGGLAQFFQSYLVAYIFWIGITLGGLGLLMLHYVAGGRWGKTIRRITEAAAGTIWLMALLFIPLIVGLRYLYPWTDPAFMASSEVLSHKIPYLNPTFFIVRAVIYFVVWFILSRILSRQSARLETSPTDLGIRSRLRATSAAGLILYVLTMTFAAIDWIMSLQPLWGSTVFGLLIIMAQGLSSLAFAIVVLPLLPGILSHDRPADSVAAAVFRDLGAVLLSFVVGWAYMAFFQLLIIWTGNLPREIIWYSDRISGGWQWLAILIALVQFALPFLALIPMRVRSNLRALQAIGLVILLITYVNYFWQVMPAFYPAGFHIHWLDFVLPIAIGGLWLFAFFGRLRVRPLQPALEIDPEASRLAEEGK